MGLHVSSQVGAVSEGPIAVGTDERLLPGVSPDVPLEKPGAREPLGTHWTHARQAVTADVHLEGAQGDVHLVAVLAAERFLVGGGTVELLVLGQSTVSRVALVAVWTLVSGTPVQGPATGRGGI